MEFVMKKDNTVRKKGLQNPAKQKQLMRIVNEIRTEVKVGSAQYLNGSKVPFGGE